MVVFSFFAFAPVGSEGSPKFLPLVAEVLWFSMHSDGMLEKYGQESGFFLHSCDFLYGTFSNTPFKCIENH